MIEKPELSDEFVDFIFDGLDTCMETKPDLDTPMIPLLITLSGGETTMTRFVADQLGDGVAMAEEHIRKVSPKPEYAMVCADVDITWEGNKCGAMLARAFDKQCPGGVEFIQRYEPDEDEAGILAADRPAWTGVIPNLLLAS